MTRLGIVGERVRVGGGCCLCLCGSAIAYLSQDLDAAELPSVVCFSSGDNECRSEKRETPVFSFCTRPAKKIFPHTEVLTPPFLMTHVIVIALLRCFSHQKANPTSTGFAFGKTEKRSGFFCPKCDRKRILLFFRQTWLCRRVFDRTNVRE